MTLKQITFDSIADGTVITSGTAASIGASAVLPNTGGVFTVKSSAAVQGARGLELVTSTAGASYVSFDFNTSTNSAADTFEGQLPQVLPTGTNKPTIAWLASSSGSTILRLMVDSTGLVQLQKVSGALVTLATGQAAGLKYQLRRWVTVGTGATDVIHVEFRTSGGATLLGSYDNTASDIGDNPVAKLFFGVSSTMPESYTMNIDSIQLDDGRTSFIPGMAVAPTLSLTGNQNVAAAATVTATATATGTGTLTYAWSVVTAQSTSTPTLTGGTTATVSLTAPAIGNLVTLQCIVTDSIGGLTATATTEVRVPRAGSATVVPLALDAIKVGTITRVGGSATDGAALADASDTTYLETGALSSTEQSAEARWEPHNSRASGQMTPLRLGTDTGTATALVKLVEATTVRQSWTQAVTATATDYTFTLDPATISAIADWGNLRVRVGFTT